MQALKLLGNSWVETPDSTGLSISDNLDLRIRVAMDNWYPTSRQTFIAKSTGGEEWSFHTEETGQGILQFVFTGGGTNIENSSVGVDFANGSLHWIRVHRVGTSVIFYTSDDDTDDHLAVTWTQLGTTQTTVATGINSGISTHVTIGASRIGGDDPVLGYVHAVAVRQSLLSSNRADPVFTGSEWDVGDSAGDTGSDGVNTWTLGGTATIAGDNVEGTIVSVEVSFGSAPFYGQPVWTDITEDVRAISTSRGRNYELDRFDAGTATFEIDNTSGWYHAHNTESPYYPNIKPMVPIRVRAAHDGTIYPIWRGYVDRWPVSYPGNIESIVTVQATDLFKALSLADASQEDRSALVTALGPVAWWRFNDDTDSSAAGTHDLTITGATTGNAGVWMNDQAGSFDGVDDFATVANEADVELRSDMTIEMWLKPERSSALTVDTFNADDSWTCPANVTSVTVDVWGGGGGGEAGDGNGPSGAGGGGGAYSRGVVAVVPGTAYTVEVGTGGAGGAGSGTNGTEGGNSWFGDGLVWADGGHPGVDQVGGAGGAAAIGVGTVRRTNGGRGAQGTFLGFLFGGGGGGGGGGGAGGTTTGGAGQPQVGSNGEGGFGGEGGGGGDGGDGGSGTAPGNGAPGDAPGGGGGGGGANPSGADGNGGAGANGRVVVSYAVAETQTPISVRGAAADPLYQLNWDGYQLELIPSTYPTGAYSLGPVPADEWHHVVVTIDWNGGRGIKGYVNGALVLDVTSGYQPPVTVRAVNIGRRATDNDRYFKGDISEIVIYNSVLTQQDVAGLYAAQLEGFETQPTGDRIEYVLGTAAVGAGTEITSVDLDPGQTIISGPNSPTDVSALEAIQIAADTEFGQFFIGADGIPTFHDRYHRLIDQASPLATLDQTDYETVHLLGRDELKVLNDIRVSPSDVAEPFIATDAASVAEYGRRTYEITIYPDDQNEGYDIALWILSRYKAPQDDIESIPFRLYEEVTDFATLLGAEIGNRYNIEVPLEGDDLDIDVYLEKISHNISLQQWTMEWVVSPAGEGVTFWLLGVAGSSELDVTTALGF